MNNSKMVEKFPLNERVVHWIGAISFIFCAITGLFLFTKGLDFLAPLFGGKTAARDVHRIAAVIFALTPVIAFFWRKESLIRFIKDVSSLDKDDIEFMKGFVPYIMNKPDYRYPPQGKYNGGEKVQAFFQVYLGMALIITGFMIWFNELFPPGLIQVLILVHALCALITILFAMGHIFFAMINPRSNAALSAIISGEVSVEKIKASNAKWYKELQEQRKV